MSELKPPGKRKNVWISDHGASQSFWWERDLDLLQVRVFRPILFEPTNFGDPSPHSNVACNLASAAAQTQ